MADAPYAPPAPAPQSQTPDASSYGPYAPGQAQTQAPVALIQPAAPPQGTFDASGAYIPSGQPAAGVTPEMAQIKRQSWGTKVYHGVLDALGGRFDTQFIPTENGVVKQQVAQTPGQQWKRIIAGAITGLGAGMAAQGTGPGSTTRAAGASIQAGANMAQTAYKQRQEEANTEFEQQQQAAMSKAQRSMMALELATKTFQLGQMKVDATLADSQRFNQWMDTVHAAEKSGGRMLGHFATPNDAYAAFKEDPSMHEDLAHGRIVTMPQVTEGKINGVMAAYVPDDWMNSMTTEDIPVTYKLYKDGKLTEVKHTIPAGQVTQATAMDIQNRLSAEQMEDHWKDIEAGFKEREVAAKEKELPSIIGEHEAQAQKARSETAGGPTNQDLGDAAEGLASGRYLMGKDFPLRTQKEQADARQYNQAANEYSMKTYNLPYSPEIVREESAFAHDKRTQALLESIDSMVGTAGQPGQLDKLIDLAAPAGLGNHLAPYQEVKQSLKTWLGNTESKNFEEALSDAQSKLGGLIGNPLLGGGDSDLKLKTAQKQFGSNITLDSLKGQAQTAKEILQNARSRMIARNRFLMQRYGAERTPINPNAGGGATATPSKGDVKIADAMAKPQNQGKSREAVIADLKAHNYNPVD